MKKFIIQALALILLAFAGLAFYTGKFPELHLTNQSNLSQLQINDIKIKVEIADNADKRKKGLGGRERLASDSGMLFVFPKVDYYNFWMKGMRFPLDFIWIKDKKVVDITKNVPSPEGEKNEDLPILTPNQPVDSVLEVNAGLVDSHEIKVGDSIK